MPRHLPKIPAFLLLAVVAFTPTARADGPENDPYEVGIRKLDDGEWADALPIYRRLIAENPTDPWSWMGLGWSLHYTNDFDAAMPAYRRALALGGLEPARVWHEMARCQVARQQPDSALDALDAALAAGLPRVHALGTDRRLEPLWPHPRFRGMTGWIDRARTTREQGWRHDLQFLDREIRRMYAVPLSAAKRAALDSALAATARAVPKLSDDALAVRIMQLARLLGDGHTEATAPFQAGAGQRALPLVFGMFDDGLFVTLADSGHAGLLWARVEAIDGHAPAELLERLDGVSAQDNPMRVLSVAPRLLRYPQILHALGLSPRDDRVELRLTDRAGALRTATVAVRPGPAPRWVRRPPDAAPPPEHAARRTEYHWLRWDPATREVFAAYNGCADDDSQSVEQFAQRLAATLDAHDVERLVVDLRWNGGGNNFLNRPLLEAIVQARKVNRPGHLFVIAGRHTFSAAMCFAAELDRYTHALFVGEPTGSSPNFVGETNPVTLPWSGVSVSVSNLAWQNTHAKDRRIWIAPRIPAPWRFADLAAGRDAALEAIRAWQPAR